MSDVEEYQRAAERIKCALAQTVEPLPELQVVLRAVQAVLRRFSPGVPPLTTLAELLSSGGYFVTLRTGLGGAGSDASLTQLRHAYLIVQTHPRGRQILVDPAFREQFAVGFHAGAVYYSCVDALPRCFVGTITTLTAAVQYLGQELALATAPENIPPWRSVQGMASNWLPLSYRDVLYAPAPAGAPAAALHPLLRSLQPGEEQPASGAAVAAPVPATPAPVAVVEYLHRRGRLVTTLQQQQQQGVARAPSTGNASSRLPAGDAHPTVVYGFVAPSPSPALSPRSAGRDAGGAKKACPSALTCQLGAALQWLRAATTEAPYSMGITSIQEEDGPEMIISATPSPPDNAAALAATCTMAVGLCTDMHLGAAAVSAVLERELGTAPALALPPAAAASPPAAVPVRPAFAMQPLRSLSDGHGSGVACAAPARAAAEAGVAKSLAAAYGTCLKAAADQCATQLQRRDACRLDQSWHGRFQDVAKQQQQLLLQPHMDGPGSCGLMGLDQLLPRIRTVRLGA